MGRRVDPGRFYRYTPGGLEPSAPGRPDAWICRRLEDYPDGQAPAGAAVAACDRCGAALAYNPARAPQVPASTPRVCMQCARIEPLPIDA
jgi:hypothetical protein